MGGVLGKLTEPRTVRERRFALTSLVPEYGWDKLTVHDAIQLLPQIQLRALDCGRCLDWQSAHTNRLMCFLRLYTNPQINSNERFEYVAEMVHLDYSSLLLDWWSFIFHKRLFTKSHEPSMSTFRVLIGIVWNASEVSAPFCEQLTLGGGVELLLTCLRCAQLAPNKLCAENADAMQVCRSLIVHAVLSILCNLLMHVTQTQTQMDTHNGVSVLVSLANSALSMTRLRALLCLAHLHQHHMDTTQMDSLLTALHMDKAHDNMHQTEVLQAINQLLTNEESTDQLVMLGLVSALINCYTVTNTDIQLNKAVCMLSFNTTASQTMQLDKKFMEDLKRVRSSAECRKDKLLSSVLNCTLFILQSSSQRPSALTQINENDDQSTIAIICHSKSSHKLIKLCQQIQAISPLLKIKHFEETDENMMSYDLIENYKLIVLCSTEPTKHSVHIRTIVFAAGLYKVPLIVLQLEEHASISWLTTILLNHQSFDIRTQHKYDRNIAHIMTIIQNYSPSDPKHLSSIQNWTKADVGCWLAENKLGDLQPGLSEFDGVLLSELRCLMMEAPCLYHCTLKHDLQIDSLTDRLRFTHALNHIYNNH